MLGLIDVASSSFFTSPATSFTNFSELFQRRIRMAALADTPACVVHLHPSITEKEEACDVAVVPIANQASWVNDDDTQNKDADPPQKKWKEEIEIQEQSNSHRKELLEKMTELPDMWDGHFRPITTWKTGIKITVPVVKLIHCS